MVWPFVSRVAANNNASTPARAHTAGNQLIFGVSYQGTPTITGVTNTAGDTFTQIGSEVTNGVNKVRLYYAYNITGHASDVCTINISAGSFTFVIVNVIELAMDGTADPLQGTNQASGTSTTISTGSITVTDPAAIIAMCETDGGDANGSNGHLAIPFNGSSGQFFYSTLKFVTASEAAELAQASAAFAIIGASFTVPLDIAGSGGGAFTFAG